MWPKTVLRWKYWPRMFSPFSPQKFYAISSIYLKYFKKNKSTLMSTTWEFWGFFVCFKRKWHLIWIYNWLNFREHCKIQWGFQSREKQFIFPIFEWVERFRGSCCHYSSPALILLRQIKISTLLRLKNSLIKYHINYKLKTSIQRIWF